MATGYPGTPSTEILEAISESSRRHLLRVVAQREGGPRSGRGRLAGGRALHRHHEARGPERGGRPADDLAYIGAVGGLVDLRRRRPRACTPRRTSRTPATTPGSPKSRSSSRPTPRRPRISPPRPGDLRAVRHAGHPAHDHAGQPLAQPGDPGRAAAVVQTDGLRQKDPPRYVPIPVWAPGDAPRGRRTPGQLRAAACEPRPSTASRWRDPALGIITGSIAYQYVREVLPEASVLKLGWSYPFPDELLARVRRQVKRLLVVEELDDILEEHVRPWASPATGRSASRASANCRPRSCARRARKMEGRRGRSPLHPRAEAGDLPAAPAGALPGLPAPRHLLRPGQVRRGRHRRHRLLQPGRLPAAEPHRHHPLHGRRHLDGPGHAEGRRDQTQGRGHGRRFDLLPLRHHRPARHRLQPRSSR